MATTSGLATPARAQVNQLPAELEEVGIDEKAGAVAPRDLRFTDQDGRSILLGDYFDGQRPVVLVLAYYQCPMLCSMVLSGLTTGLAELADPANEWTAGNKFRVVTVSFDTRDNAAAAHAKRQTQLRAYNRPVPGRGWDFLVGDEHAVKQLAASVGFKYRWDERQKQFAHAAGAFVFTPGGRLSRTLFGMQFPGPALRLALVEASAGKLGGAWDRILLFCYHYDPDARGYVLAARRVMKLAGVFTMLGLAAFLVALVRNDGGGRRHRQPGRRPPVERLV